MAIERLGAAFTAGMNAVGLDRNWHPIPREGEEGHAWTCGKWNDVSTKEVQKLLKESSSGNLFPIDTHDWAFAKNIGALAVGKYVYGAAFVGHAAKGVLATAQTLRTVWGTYQLKKNEADFDLSTFAKAEIRSFHEAEGHFLQAAKYGAVAGVLWMDPAVFGLGLFGLGTVGTALSGYALFNPIGFRSVVHKVDSWCRPANLMVLADESIKGLSAWNAAKAVADGSLPLGRIFNMHCVGNVSEKDNGSPNPRFTLVGDDKEEVEEEVKGLRKKEE
ncbi:MAG: hypothetical protein KR126chlam3_00521 [Chlamydiae bacterium]|nr:hypothetical protein [Chlamydiota bacterium]